MCHTHDCSPVLGTVLHAYGFQNPPKLECIQTRRWFWMLPPLLPLAQLCNFPHFVKPKGWRSRGWLTLGDQSGPVVGLGNPGPVTKTTSENKGLAARSEFDSQECGSRVAFPWTGQNPHRKKSWGNFNNQTGHGQKTQTELYLVKQVSLHHPGFSVCFFFLISSHGF